MKNKISCPESLTWLIPYYEEIKSMLPKHRLIKIHQASLSKGKIQRICAQLWKIEKSYDFELTIYSQYWSYVSLKPLKRKRMNYSKIDMLVTFAHEIAHITHFYPHDTKHKSLEALLILSFMGRLESEGYISEEHELKKGKVK
tara:strand:- start:10949 stop:11377 length:429 start_codon:yes stop_codon:yes gene_type:complete